MKKPKTQQQLDRATDLRLQKTYNITLDDYNKLLAAGDGKCWICQSLPGTRRLHVDHDHSWKKVKITTTNYSDCWQAIAGYNGAEYYDTGRTKSGVLREVKRQLKRASVRGLCCAWCNRGLRFYKDNAESLMRAHEYIENFGFGHTAKILESPLTGQETP